MRGAWGKSYGTAARCDIGQVLMSIRTQEAKTQIGVEACRRAKFKFPGRQKIHVSSKFGFTKFDKGDYKKWQDAGRLIPNGIDVRWLSSRGPLHRLIGKQAAAELAGRRPAASRRRGGRPETRGQVSG